MRLHTLGAVLDRCEHGDNGEVIEGNDGIRAALLTHPRPTEPRAHNNVHDARVPAPQVTFDERESHLRIASIDDSVVDVGQRISGCPTLVDTPSRD